MVSELKAGRSRDGFAEWLRAVNASIVDELAEHLRLRPTLSPLGRVRVVLVDDHALMRLSLRTVLESEPDIEVVGEAGNECEALVKATELLPDLVLLDVKMPARDGIGGGIEAVSAIKAAVPSTRVVMLAMSEDEADLYEAIKAGASGYLLKDVLPHEVADSIRAVVGGQSLISPQMAANLLTEFAAMVCHGKDRKNPGSPAPRLTDRELEVLKLIATGANNSKIATTLFISENTVKNHARNILEKLWSHYQAGRASTTAARSGMVLWCSEACSSRRIVKGSSHVTRHARGAAVKRTAFCTQKLASCAGWTDRTESHRSRNPWTEAGSLHSSVPDGSSCVGPQMVPNTGLCCTEAAAPAVTEAS